MRHPLLLLSLTLLFAASAACRGPAPDAGGGAGGVSADAPAGGAEASAMRLEVPEDPAVGPATLRVYLLEDGAGVSGAEVEITGTMTHAGMVPVVREAPRTEPGLYVADDFEFTMAGDWIVTAEATLPDGTEHEEEVVVTVRQP